jgi:ATP-dependent protease ClpP protease subunit
MPNWNDIMNEAKELGGTYDVLRRRYLSNLFAVTGRNTIVYYSGWLQKPDQRSTVFSLSDADKTGFMSAIHGLDRAKGLDLILHTPGGDAAATESLVRYLRSMFNANIRAIVPELAMSAGTMVACACSEIVMGKHSSLGPIDPQFNGLPAHGVTEEFEKAQKEIKAQGQLAAFLWTPIIAKYPPTFVGECYKAIEWTKQIVKEWLQTGMCSGEANPALAADKIVRELADHALTKSHARHIAIDRAREIGLKVVALEEDQKLQDAVLSVHHCCIQTLSATNAVKIIENHSGVAFVVAQQQQLVTIPG